MCLYKKYFNSVFFSLLMSSSSPLKHNDILLDEYKKKIIQ